ncbi:histidine kinase [Actinocorallia sp. B10E7]|uniref:sensor histidine kinase n=1 Tax=Actinocorallia sp. B10E7 TaxID=3153558 RepID=UPI00325D3876
MDARPLLRRVPPGIWAALAWCAALAHIWIGGIRLPGEYDEFGPGGSIADLPPSNLVTLLIAVPLTMAGCALLGRRWSTSLALLLAGAVTIAMALNSSEITFAEFLPVEVALAFTAVRRSRQDSAVALLLAVGTLAVFAGVRLALGFVIGTSELLVVALTAVVVWLAGVSVRQEREHTRTLQEQAITDERLRIARELHDQVAHTIGIIAIQSGAAKMVIGTRPEQAREALDAVENASRETLAGLRRMLGALRQAEPSAAPAPGLADVKRLAASTAAAGVQVDVRWRGRRRALPAEIDLSAFRIIQESVTNVVRHARTPRCSVLIEQRDGELAIEVVDSGRGGDGGTGYGIVGMRERVSLLNGEFSAGPRPSGGFRVAAILPVP